MCKYTLEANIDICVDFAETGSNDSELTMYCVCGVRGLFNSETQEWEVDTIYTDNESIRNFIIEYTYHGKGREAFIALCEDKAEPYEYDAEGR